MSYTTAVPLLWIMGFLKKILFQLQIIVLLLQIVLGFFVKMMIQTFFNSHIYFPEIASAPSVYTPQSSVKLNKTS